VDRDKIFKILNLSEIKSIKNQLANPKSKSVVNPYIIIVHHGDRSVYHTVTFFSDVTIRRGLDWMLGLLATLT
jgi:hypothetical protein